MSSENNWNDFKLEFYYPTNILKMNIKISTPTPVITLKLGSDHKKEVLQIELH